MRYAMTTWKISSPNEEHTDALKAWRDHCAQFHPQIRAIRSYAYNGGTEYVWLEEFADYHDFQGLVDSVDDQCAAVMGAVMAHAVPGTLGTGIWLDAI